MSCSDDLKNIDWNIPQIPCDDVGNMDRWKSYNESMDAWTKKGDLERVTTQCICQNGSTCYAQEKCSNDLFNNVGSVLTDPACVSCITQSPECRRFAFGLSKLGILLKNSQNNRNITPNQAKSIVKEMCNININSLESQKISDVLNGNSTKKLMSDKLMSYKSSSSSSSSPVWTKPETWVIIGVVALVLFLTGIWIYSRRSKVSRHVVTNK
jgi:hypothetical protein